MIREPKLGRRSSALRPILFRTTTARDFLESIYHTGRTGVVPCSSRHGRGAFRRASPPPFGKACGTWMRTFPYDHCHASRIPGVVGKTGGNDIGIRINQVVQDRELFSRQLGRTLWTGCGHRCLIAGNHDYRLQAGTDMVVSLLEPGEEEQLLLEGEAATAAA